MKFKYIGHCAAGYVQFSRPNEPTVVMPEGEAVEVPSWLAGKLAANSHFEAVSAKPEAVKDSSGASVSSQSDDDDLPTIKAGMGECPDCGGVFRLRKDGLLYKHACGN